MVRNIKWKNQLRDRSYKKENVIIIENNRDDNVLSRCLNR